MANRFWVGGNANWDGTAGTKWSLTSGGAGGQAVPTSSDDVFLDNGTGTGNVTIATQGANAKTINCTNYVGTLTFNNTLTVAGSVTFVAGMTIAGTSNLIVNATATLTSGGLTFTGGLSLINAITYTLADSWTVNGLFTFGSSGVSTVMNGNTLNLAGGFTLAGSNMSGTTSIVFGGTGTFTVNAGSFFNNFTINTAGTLTWGGTGTLGYLTGTFTYTAGSFSGSTPIFNIKGSATVASSGMSWNQVTLSGASGVTLTLTNTFTVTGLVQYSPSGSQTYTIAGVGFFTSCGSMSASAATCTIAFPANDITIVGNLQIGGGAGTTATWNGANALLVGGNFTTTGTSSAIITGTLTFTMAGTGSIFGGVSNTINNILIINTSGTVTVDNTNALNLGGTTAVTITAFGTLTLTGTTINITGAKTLTVSQSGVVFNILTTNSTTSFLGTQGFTTGTFTCSTAGRTLTWKSTNTYIITTALTLRGTAASNIVMVASTGASRAIFTLNQGATQSVEYVDSTDMDSSVGQTIWDYKSTLSNNLNWVDLATPSTTLVY